MAHPPLIDRLRIDSAHDEAALRESLLRAPASIAPKYLYDELGCALFDAICRLDEYYPTRVERGIFERYRAEIAAAAGAAQQLVDLGAGDGRKAQGWFAPLRISRYVAVDIARSALAATLDRVAMEHPQVDSVGVITDFASELLLDGVLAPVPTVFFYPGSSIGNFAPAEAVALLRRVHAAGRRSDRVASLLIGVDLQKDEARLNAAYDDALGVTAAFNRNVLRHVNRILGADFDPRAFVHRASYAADPGRMEMYLEAASMQTVRIGDRTRVFAAGERILTEHSWKYTVEGFTALLRAAGFDRVRCWTDHARDFAVLVAA